MLSHISLRSQLYIFNTMATSLLAHMWIYIHTKFFFMMSREVGACETNLSHFPPSSDSKYTFLTPGEYNYHCGTGQGPPGNLSVVSTQYTISLCRDCEVNRSQYYITTGDSLQWVFVPSRGIRATDCSMILTDESGQNVLEIFPNGIATISYHR